MEVEEVRTIPAGKPLCGSQIGRRRVLTALGVGDVWEQFCKEKNQIIIWSFRAVALALPIDGSCYTEISIKRLDTADLIVKLKDWHLGGLDIGENDPVEISGKDNNKSSEFGIGDRGIIT